MYATVQAHERARQQVLRTLQFLVEIHGINIQKVKEQGPKPKRKTVVFPGKEPNGISVMNNPDFQWVCG